MSIVIFGDLFTFPEGSAATNRVYTYAKGFIANGISVHVICLTNVADPKQGVVDSVHYYHPLAQETRSKNLLIRRWKRLKEFYDTYRLIKKINQADKIIAINSWSNAIVIHLFGYLFARSVRTKFIIECSEHPLRFYQSGFLKKKRGLANFFIESSMADGIFCISNYLMNFYTEQHIDTRKLFLVPSTVDPDRFIKVKNKPVDYDYIGYFGSLTFSRDNVDLLIEAFAEFSKLHANVNLILGGFCSESERNDIEKLISTLNIKNRVLLLGYLTREEIVQYITHANILVMVRSHDLQSQASYPSKLTEFLASARPVISVNVGEIPLYLKDGENAFLINPGNAKELLEKLDFVYSNPLIAKGVGQKGKQLTETIFNYKFQAERMIGFINHLSHAD